MARAAAGVAANRRADETLRPAVPYVFFWTPDRRCYHARCDTTEHLDTAHLAAISRLAGALVTRLSDTPADLAAARAHLGCGGR